MGIERVTRPMLCVLEVLVDAHQQDTEMHGWPIIKATGLKGPTVYRVLDRLEDSEWVTSRWEDDPEPGRPRRRFYRLTPNGCAQAVALLHERGRDVISKASKLRLAFDWSLFGWLGAR